MLYTITTRDNNGTVESCRFDGWFTDSNGLTLTMARKPILTIPHDDGVIARVGINERTSEAPQPIVEILATGPDVKMGDEVVGCENE